MRLSKRAGILPLPENLFNEIWPTVKQQYAIRVLENIEEKPLLTEKVAKRYGEYLDEKLQQVEELRRELFRKNLNQREEKKLLKEYGLDVIYFPNMEDDFTYKEDQLEIFINSLGYWEIKGHRGSSSLDKLLALVGRFITNQQDSLEPAEDYTIVEYKLLKTTAQKDAKNAQRIKEKRFPIDEKETLVVEFVENIDHEDGEVKGVYYPLLYWIKILINSDPGNIRTYQHNLEDLKITLAHELRHYIQDITNKTKNLPDRTYGMPPRRVRNPEEYSAPFPLSKRPPHALRDVEFHTRLGDEATKFKAILNKSSPKSTQMLFKKFVGLPIQKPNLEEDLEMYYDFFDAKTSYFFEQLKYYQPEKWKIAVKYLLNEVSK